MGLPKLDFYPKRTQVISHWFSSIRYIQYAV